VRLRESDERHDFAMRAINEGTYDWDVEKGVVYYSERVYQVLGLSPADFHTAQGWLERIHPDDRPRYLEATRAHFVRETDRFECDYRYRARDGSWRWARQHGLAVRDADGRAVRLIGSTGDITELKERERELAEQAAEQAAVRELLEAISHTAFDLDGVLRTLIERAARLCHADKGFIFRQESDVYRLAFDYGGAAQAFREFVSQHEIRAGRDTLVGRTALRKAVVHIHDVLTDPEYRWPQSQQLGGQRTMLGVPIVRDDVVVGVIALWKERVEPFTPAQVQLVATFASQAAIAIENARLFNDTKEALEQQTATAAILRVISSSPTDLAPVYDAVAKSVSRLCDAPDVVIVRAEAAFLRFAANVGPFGQTFGPDLTIPIDRGSIAGRATLDRQTIQVRDLAAEPEDEYPVGKGLQQRYGHRTMVAAPLLLGDTALGAIAMLRTEVRPFSDKQLALLRTFADQAVIAIQNVRLFNETKEALDWQTATAEILRVIANSPSDVRPVFDAIVHSAARLVPGSSVNVSRLVGDCLELAAYTPVTPSADEMLRGIFPIPATDVGAIGEAIRTKSPYCVYDFETDSNVSPEAREVMRARGLRSTAYVPIARGDVVHGLMHVSKVEPGPFPEKWIALLQTFADQAVIAIENVRLFQELQVRNRDLTEALEQQTATSEILRVIAGSPTDITPVLEAVAENAARLCDANDVVVMMNAGDVLRAVKSTGPFGERFGANFTIPITRGSAAGRAVVDRTTVQVPDFGLESDEEYPVGRQHRRTYGNHGALASPLLRGDAVLGVIAVLRRDVRPFSDRQMTLLQTFADQAVIAIENVRLFNETKEALDQLKASAEVLQVISSSVADTKPVFEKILASCERLFEGQNVGITLVGDDGAIHLGPYRGPARQDLEKMYPLPLSGASGSGSAILARRVMHYPDIEGGADVPDPVRSGSRMIGSKSIIFAPMVWEGRGIGTIFVGRAVAGDYSEKEIGLLKTFADQAVIAIQNARLFHEIEEKSHQLEIANRHKSAFLANMSHELRTPLNAVIGFSEMLAARYFGDLTEKQAEYVNDIHGSGRHLLSLINDILDLSKIEAGRMDLETVEFDLPAALENAITLVRERAQRGGVALRLDTDPALGAFVGDERKLKQVVLNLLSNAVKFTPRGGAVSVAARRVDGAAEISVSDTGAGIAPEDQEAIFEAFRQVGTDVTRKREGTGLGLALTRRFVELHGGTIAVRSALGKGSTFTVTLPVRHGE
jgi:PAS domain S-box-containing protein